MVQLADAEPVLFAEFKDEYAQMGEKSFDHTKKFWFNKLRKWYHLKEQPKPAKTVIEKTEIASQAEPLSSPTIEQKPAYAPKFKPRVISQPQPAKSIEKEIQDTLTSEENPTYEEEFNLNNLDSAELNILVKPDEEQTPKPAFKPRFKAAVTKPAELANAEETKSSPEEAKQPDTETPKPAFKPRFKTALTKAAEPVKNEEINQLPEEVVQPDAESPKPAYKPRFSAKAIAQSEEEKPDEPQSSPEEAEKPTTETAKPAYKPRFNMKTIPPKTEG